MFAKKLHPRVVTGYLEKIPAKLAMYLWVILKDEAGVDNRSVSLRNFAVRNVLKGTSDLAYSNHEVELLEYFMAMRFSPRQLPDAEDRKLYSLCACWKHWQGSANVQKVRDFLVWSLTGERAEKLEYLYPIVRCLVFKPDAKVVLDEIVAKNGNNEIIKMTFAEGKRFVP